MRHEGIQKVCRSRFVLSCNAFSRVQKAHSELSSKYSSMEVEANLKDSEAIPLFHEKERLQTEMENLHSKSRWLANELKTKSEDYQRLLQDSRDQQMRLQVQLQHVENEKAEASTKNTEMTQIQDRLHDQVEQLTNDLRKQSHEKINLKENYELELQNERDFVGSQKDLLATWEERYNGLQRENHSLKTAAAQAVEATERDVEAMKKELKEKYETLLHEQGAEYETRLSQQPATVAALPESLSTDDMVEDNEPLNLTEVYERWEEAKKALRAMTRRAERAERDNKKILSELKDQTPRMLRQREDYEAAIDQVQDFQQRLEFSINEKENAQKELSHVRRLLDQTESRYNDKVADTERLAEQVQALLCSRASGEASSQGIPTSVTEMQQQNQRLLSENRALQQTVNDLEDRLQTDELRSTLTAKEAELEALQEEQKKQERLIAKVAEQGEIYKFVCNTHGIGLDSGEVTIEEVSRQQAEKTRALESSIKGMETTIATLRGENDRLSRDKRSSDESAFRYQFSNTELMKDLGDLRREITSVKGDLGREASEASYYRDKCTRLEESLQRFKGENEILDNTRSELQRSMKRLSNGRRWLAKAGLRGKYKNLLVGP